MYGKERIRSEEQLAINEEDFYIGLFSNECNKR